MDIKNLWSDNDLNLKKQNSRCLSVNTILEGKYLVGPVLGQGGFGITYVGYDLNMESKIAIKEYFPVELVSRDTTTMHGDRVLSLSGEKSVTYKQGLKKYVAEAQNVSQFSEVPGVVSVKDFFYANETAYIVMEYIDGISLKDYLKEKGGRLTEEETLKIVKPVLEALVQVHKSGIIHRDISPDNIMLTFEGRGHNKIQSVKLIDFGAARMTAKNDQKSLTIILKHGYAPEEQYRTHGEQGPWTDVYALCAVLYRMLTGETPVPAMDRMFKDELKTLEQCGAKVSSNTSAAILKGLAVKKDDRIQSVQELIGALYGGKKVTEVHKAGEKKGLYIGIGAVLTAVVLGCVLFLSGGQKTVIEPGTTAAIESTLVSEADPKQDAAKEVGAEADKETLADVDLYTQDEALGEQIVFYRSQRSIASPRDGQHLLICKPDGTVEARGNNDMGQCDVEYWDHVVAVEAEDQASFGLRTDGTVLYAGNSGGFEEAALWTDIVDIQATQECVIGLKKDGTIVSAVDASRARNNDDVIETAMETASWNGIKSIASYNYGIYALTEDGTVLVAGDDLETEISGWTEVDQLVADSWGVYGICEDGTIIANKKSEVPQEAFIFYDAGYGVLEDGTAYARLRNNLPANTSAEIFSWKNLVSISCTANTYFGLQSDGTILEYMEVDESDTAPEKMENLKFVQCSESLSGGDFLFAVAKNGEKYKYGEQMSFGRVLDYAADPCWYNGYAALYEDGTFLYTTGSEECHSIDGVVQVVEMIKHQIWHEDGKTTVIYAYLILMEDGTVQRLEEGFDTVGYQYYANVWEDFADVENWTDIVQLEVAGIDGIYGLKADGSVVAAGKRTQQWIGDMSEDTMPGYKQIGATKNESLFVLEKTGYLTIRVHTEEDKINGLLAADGWKNVESFSIGSYHIAALLEDGTVKATGGNHCGQCDVEGWKDVVYLTTGNNCTLGITSAGKLLMAGSLY